MQTFSGGACPQTPLVEKIGLEFRVDIFTNFKGINPLNQFLFCTQGFPDSPRRCDSKTIW
jgi:hypothetical protein